ncbi:hypothetical protein VV869_08215 [Photobacterium sp. MCCC 1A19761]|uniref:hypothetical protein n=1 Tax=Photobacterium sp. MCCC 1A19761 TaxID=3115000 RepID=UPI00307F7A02
MALTTRVRQAKLIDYTDQPVALQLLLLLSKQFLNVKPTLSSACRPDLLKNDAINVPFIASYTLNS